MSRLSARVNGMLEREDKRAERAWNAFWNEEAWHATEKHWSAYEAFCALSEEGAVALLEPYWDALDGLETFAEWAIAVAPIVSDPSPRVAPHAIEPPPDEPPGVMDALRHRFYDSDSERERMALSWGIVFLALARATRRIQSDSLL